MSRTVAIECALAKEAALFFDLPGDAPKDECGITWAIREIGEDVVVVARAGMGKINAAAAAQFLVDKFAPEALVFSGIAGGLNPLLGMGDVVVAKRLESLDADMSVIAEDEPHLESFPCDKGLVKLAIEELASRGFVEVEPVEVAGVAEDAPFGTTVPHDPRFVCGAIATSDLFNTETNTLSDLRRRHLVDAEEMEGAAAAQVAARARIAFLAVRSLSNVCGEAYDDLSAREDDLVATARLAAEISLATLRRYLAG